MRKPVHPTAAEWRRSLPTGSQFHLVRTEPVRSGHYSSDMLLTQICNNEPQRGPGGFERLSAAHGFTTCCRECLHRMRGPSRKFYQIDLLPELTPLPRFPIQTNKDE